MVHEYMCVSALYDHVHVIGGKDNWNEMYRNIKRSLYLHGLLSLYRHIYVVCVDGHVRV